LEAAALPAALRVPGRLDCEVALPLPGAAGRLGMLTAELAARGLASSRDDLKV
jgi:ATP-dependent 26S proteasome regulatory subunit